MNIGLTFLSYIKSDHGLKLSSKGRDTLADFLLSALVLESLQNFANNPVADFCGLEQIRLNANPTRSDLIRQNANYGKPAAGLFADFRGLR